MSNIIDFYKTKYNKNIVNKLIGINIIAFIIQFMMPQSIVNYFMMPIGISHFITQPWSLMTAMFMHGGIMHILFNMFWLWQMGEILLKTINQKDFLKLYLYGGAAASLVVLLYGYLYNYENYMLGVSGAISVIIYSAIYTIPNQKVNLFGIFKLKMKHIAWGLFVMNFFGLFGCNAGGNIAHISGSIIGYIYIKNRLNRKWYKDILSIN